MERLKVHSASFSVNPAFQVTWTTQLSPCSRVASHSASLMECPRAANAVARISNRVCFAGPSSRTGCDCFAASATWARSRSTGWA